MVCRNRLFAALAVALSAMCAHVSVAAQESAVSASADADADSSAQAEATTLDGVTVTAGFIDSSAKSAMKMEVDSKDTPFSVTSYSESFMAEMASANVADMYKYMTGIQKAGNTAYDMNIRGFKTDVNDRNALMVDGLPGLVSRFASPPTIGTERVEVVKGPASVLYGQAQPGGFVNLISKKPESKASTQVQLRASTYTSGLSGFGDTVGASVALDSTGPLDEQGRFLYRFIIEDTKDLAAWRDDTFSDGLYVAPSLTWNPTDSTSVMAKIEHRESKMAYDRGVVTPARDIDLLPALTNRYQEPGDYVEEEATSLSFSVDHWFENGAAWNFSGRLVDLEDRTRGMESVSIRPNLTTLQRRVSWLSNARTSSYFDTNFVFPFETGPVSHRMIVGAGGGHDTARLVRDRFYASPALDISIYNPVHGIYPDPGSLPLGTLTDRYNVVTARGLYASDLMELSDHWKLNLGVRTSDENQSITNKMSAAPAVEKKARKTLPMAGLMYQPSDEWTFYTSYSTSFVPAPASVYDVNGENPFKPEYAEQYEVGAKAELFEGRLIPTLSVFTITKDDSVTGFTCPPGSIGTGTCSQQIGSQRSRGVEFELTAHPVDNLQIVAGLAHTKAEILESLDPVQEGARIQNSPENSAHVWARYNFREGWGAALGASWTGSRAGNLPSSANPRIIELPSYAVVDLGLYHDSKRYSVALKVNNLLDEEYIETTGVTSDVHVWPGAPRQVLLTLNMKF